MLCSKVYLVIWRAVVVEIATPQMSVVGPPRRRRRRNFGPPLFPARLVASGAADVSHQRLVATSRRRRRNFGPPLGLWAPPSSSKFWTTYLVPDPSRRRRFQPPPMSFEEISVVVVERAAPHSQISPAMISYCSSRVVPQTVLALWGSGGA